MKTKPEGFFFWQKGEFDQENYSKDLGELVPQLYAGRRFAVDLTPYPTLLRIEAAAATLPAFAAAHAEVQSDARVPSKS